jgi:hypothetical protein
MDVCEIENCNRRKRRPSGWPGVTLLLFPRAKSAPEWWGSWVGSCSDKRSG